MVQSPCKLTGLETTTTRYYCLRCGQLMTHIPSESHHSDLYRCPHCNVRWKRIHAVSAGDCDSWEHIDQTID